MYSFGVIFDMDGVIVDSNPYHKTALKQFCREHGYELSDEHLIKKIFGRTNREWITALFGQLPEEKIIQYTEQKEALYRQLFDKDIKPLPGLLKFLDALTANNIPVAIGTSAPLTNVAFTLSRTGTQKYFKTILHDSFVTHSKPHPEIYLKSAKALGLPNAKCIVIEDSLSGVAAGKAAGSPVVGITTTHSESELLDCALTINNFETLKLEHLQALIR
jgi:HAD superfamily hydrolase (TIGR01509 family)